MQPIDVVDSKNQKAGLLNEECAHGIMPFTSQFEDVMQFLVSIISRVRIDSLVIEDALQPLLVSMLSRAKSWGTIEVVDPANTAGILSHLLTYLITQSPASQYNQEDSNLIISTLELIERTLSLPAGEFSARSSMYRIFSDLLNLDNVRPRHSVPKFSC